MKYNNDNVRRQDRLLEEDRAYALLREGEYGVLSMTTPTGGAYGIPLNFVWDRQENIYIHCAPRGRKLDCIAPLSGGVFLCDWEYPCRTRTILHKLFLHRFDMPGTDRSFAGRTDARPPVADGKIHTGTSGRRGKICGKVIPPHGNHPATDSGVQQKMQTDTIKGKDAPSPFPIQKIYSSTLPALFPQAASGATGPIHRCLQRS